LSAEREVSQQEKGFDCSVGDRSLAVLVESKCKAEDAR
jgi:hypothetical protein